jgi:hypothetical protein
VLRAHFLTAAVLLSACLPATAQATQSVRLQATLTPERLGQGTTLGFGFQIHGPADRVPSPLTEIDVRYPENLGIALSGLGLATCSQATLEASGPYGCPPNSVMGSGSALAELPIGPEIIRETTPITIVRAPNQEGHIALLFYATSPIPVDAQIVFPGLLLPAAPPFGGRVDINVPLVPSIAGAPDVAIVLLRSTIGPRGITYYEQVEGKTLAYQPKGLLLPNRCPRGGFPFAAEFSFQDGSHARAKTTVPCPGHKQRRSA